VTNFLNHLTNVGFDLLQALLGIGFVIALVKVVFGRQDGCSHLVGILFVAIIIELWRAGELASVFQSLVQMLTSGGNAPSIF
jgi:hypothetical protein